MPYDIELVSGMRIGQLTFHRHEARDGPGYPLYGKYQGQVYPTESAAWADEEFLNSKEQREIPDEAREFESLSNSGESR